MFNNKRLGKVLGKVQSFITELETGVKENEAEIKAKSKAKIDLENEFIKKNNAITNEQALLDDEIVVANRFLKTLKGEA